MCVHTLNVLLVGHRPNVNCVLRRVTLGVSYISGLNQHKAGGLRVHKARTIVPNVDAIRGMERRLRAAVSPAGGECCQEAVWTYVVLDTEPLGHGADPRICQQQAPRIAAGHGEPTVPNGCGNLWTARKMPSAFPTAAHDLTEFVGLQPRSDVDPALLSG